MPEWIAITREVLNKVDTWYDYIHSAFLDLLDEQINDYEGFPPPNHPLPLPPIEISNFSVTLEDTNEPKFSITLNWDALEFDKPSLDECIEGQLHYINYKTECKIYEQNNDSMDWIIIIE